MVVDQAVLDILGKMLQPLSELEREFHNHEESKRTQFIATLLAGALNSVDPVKLIQDFQVLSLYLKKIYVLQCTYPLRSLLSYSC